MYNVSNMTEHTYPYDSSLTNLINTIHLIWTIPIYPSNGKSDLFLRWRSQQWVLEFVCRIFYLEKFTPHRWIAHNHATELMLCASHYSQLHAIPVQLGCWPNLFGAFYPGSKYNSPTVLTHKHANARKCTPNDHWYKYPHLSKSVHAFRVCLYLVHNSTVTAGYVKVLLWCSYPWLVHCVLVLGHVTCCKQY